MIGKQKKSIIDIYQNQLSTTSKNILISFEQEHLDDGEFWHIVQTKKYHLCSVLDKYYIQDSEICIGISNNRSLETISDLLAILLAGCVFVPYDPFDPKERQNFIFEDANVKMVLDSGQLRLLRTDEVINLKSKNFKESICSRNTSLAYIMYTSGSTGRPKGVRVSHQALWHFFEWWASLEVNRLSKIVDFSGSLTFDASITTTLIALALGKSIIICPESIKKSPEAFLNYLILNKIDLCKTTPSYFRLLCNAIKDCSISIPHYMSWLLIGEEMSGKDCALWLDYHPEHCLYNAYGPTEATVYCSTFKIDQHNIKQFVQKIPIEQNSRWANFHVVDEHLGKVPYGVKGELCIEGPILADGYHNLSEQSALAFIDMADGRRLYKTGDQVVMHADGTIFFGGRMDHQVKISGVRVELDEVKNALSLMLGVADSVVLTKMVDQSLQLVAIVAATFEGDEATFVDGLKCRLSTRLSASMMPQQFIMLKELPHNKAGKIDLEALRHLVERQSFAEGEATSPLEKSLLEIWRKTLKEEKIGVDSDFFAVGGSSLLALEVIDKINRHFGVMLSANLLFKKPTVRMLCKAIDNGFI